MRRREKEEEEDVQEEEGNNRDEYLSSTRIQLPNTDMMLARIRKRTTTIRNQIAVDMSNGTR